MKPLIIFYKEILHFNYGMRHHEFCSQSCLEVSYDLVPTYPHLIPPLLYSLPVLQPLWLPSCPFDRLHSVPSLSLCPAASSAESTYMVTASEAWPHSHSSLPPLLVTLPKFFSSQHLRASEITFFFCTLVYILLSIAPQLT